MRNVMYNNAERPFYKPFATRTPVLFTLLVLTLALIAVTELGCRKIPAHKGVGRVGDAVSGVLGMAKVERELVERQSSNLVSTSAPGPASVALSFASPVATPFSAPSVPTPAVSPTASPSTIVSQVPGGFLSVGSSETSVSTGVPRNSAFLSPGTGPSITSSIPTIPEPTATGPFLSVGKSPTTPSISPTPNPGSSPTGPDVQTTFAPTQGSSVYLDVGNPSGPSIAYLLPPSNYLIPGSKYLSPGTGETVTQPAPGPTQPPQPTIVVVNGQQSTYSAGGAATGANGYPLPVLTVIGSATLTQTPVLSVIGGKTFAVLPAVQIVGSETLTQTPYYTVVDGNPMALTPAVQVVDGQTVTQTPFLTVIDGTTYTATPYLTVVNGKTFTTTPAPNTAISTGAPPSGYIDNGGSPTDSGVHPTATVVNSTGTYYAYSDGKARLAPQITLREYISVSFVPIILAVVFMIPWRILDSTIKEMEPFYQLHQKGGSLAKDSLCLDYSTSFLITVPFKSISRGQVIVFWSSLISLAVLAIAPLSSEAFFVSLSGSCGPNSPGPCHAVWGVHPILARVIQGILSFVAFLLILIILFSLPRSSGVYNEPLSIAGLAALFHKSPALKGFREIDSMIKNKDLKRVLAGRRYGLCSFIADDQTRCHGIVPLDADSESGFVSSAPSPLPQKGYYSAVTTTDLGIDTSDRPQLEHSVHDEFWARRAAMWDDVKRRVYYVAVFIMLGGLFALITYYHWTGPDPVTGKSSGFEQFMDSEGFGVRFMMTALGVVIKLFWSTIDQDFRKMEPYRRLLLGSSKPEDSVLVPVWMSPLSAILPSLRRRHFLVTLICFISVLSEFLPITLANIAYTPAMTKRAYEICNAMSMGILGLMLLSILVLIFRPRRHVRLLPRAPTTVASLGVYVASVGDIGERTFLDGMVGLAEATRRERDGVVKGWGPLYSLGLVDGNELRIDDDRRVRRLWSD